MAVESVQPDERVERRSDVYQRMQDTFGSGRQQEQQYEQDKLIREAGKGTLAAIKQGGAGLAKVSGDVEKAAQMLPVQQAGQTGQQALTGEQMSTDIALSKRAQAAKNIQRKMQESLGDMALNITRRAFESGIDAKRMVMHENNMVADLAFNQMYEDYKAGRTTKREVEQIYRRLKADAQAKQIKAREMMTKTLSEVRFSMEQGNVENAKRRLVELFDAQKEALDQAARAQNAGAILTGAFKLVAVGAATVYGGPAGGAVAAAALS